jgi:arsenite methyltransferase
MTTAIIKSAVRERYGAIAESVPKGCGCAPDCCGDGIDLMGDAYTGIDGHVAEADLGLGCGLPTRHAGIRPGDVVLDLGAGAGNDVFVARHLVGETGHVIGVDMTEAMVGRARANLARLGYTNVDFRLGEIESLPVADAAVDVVISNCVLNLVPDKARAFAETFRVLRPGGHFCVSDIVATSMLTEAVQKVAALHVGCIAGAMAESDYLTTIESARFTEVSIVERRAVRLSDQMLLEHLSATELDDFRGSGAELLSVTVLGSKPRSCCAADCCA